MKRILIATVASLVLAFGVATQAGSAARIDADTSIDQATSPDRGARDSGYRILDPQLAPAPGDCMAACGDYATEY